MCLYSLLFACAERDLCDENRLFNSWVVDSIYILLSMVFLILYTFPIIFTSDLPGGGGGGFFFFFFFFFFFI